MSEWSSPRTRDDAEYMAAECRHCPFLTACTRYAFSLSSRGLKLTGVWAGHVYTIEPTQRTSERMQKLARNRNTARGEAGTFAGAP